MWGGENVQRKQLVLICLMWLLRPVLHVSFCGRRRVFCGSGIPLCLVRGNVFFEKLHKFQLLGYSLNTVCVFFLSVFFMKFLWVLVIFTGLLVLCASGSWLFPCLLWQKEIFRNISGFHFAFPCYNFSLLCKSEKEMWLLNFGRFSLSPTVLWRQMAYQKQAWVSEGYGRNWKRDPKISCGWLRTVVICEYLWSRWIINRALSQPAGEHQDDCALYN